MSKAKRSELVIHYALTIGLLVAGNFIGGAIIAFLLGKAAFMVFGSVIPELTAVAHVIGYGVLGLVIVHFVTGGWWLAKCNTFIDEMIVLHENAMKRLG